MRTVKRNNVANINYTRYYEADNNISFCSACPAKSGINRWEFIYEGAKFKPINTNWKNEDTISIDKVIVCESPSNEETSSGMPSVGATGAGIYTGILGKELRNGWLDELDRTTYRTNIVRCQADAGIKGRTTLKNQRVREAWIHCKFHLEEEFRKILCNCIGEITIYIAIGKSFPVQNRESRGIIEKLIHMYKLDEKVEIKELHHPSAKI